MGRRVNREFNATHGTSIHDYCVSVSVPCGTLNISVFLELVTEAGSVNHQDKE